MNKGDVAGLVEWELSPDEKAALLEHTKWANCPMCCGQPPIELAGAFCVLCGNEGRVTNGTRDVTAHLRLSYQHAFERITTLSAENERLVKANRLRMEETHKERAEAKLWFEKAQEWKDENATLSARVETLEAALREASTRCFVVTQHLAAIVDAFNGDHALAELMEKITDATEALQDYEAPDTWEDIARQALAGDDHG